MSDQIYTRQIDITFDRLLTVSIFSNGDSLEDLARDKPQQKFDAPFSYDKINVTPYKSYLSDLLKKLNRDMNNLEITIYEPPLTVKEQKLTIDETNSIGLYLPDNENKDTQKDIFSYALRFTENAIYYVTISSDTDSYHVELRSTGNSPQNTLIPYKGDSKGWTLNFRNQLFYGEICIFEGNKPLFTIPVLVFPKKIEPQESMTIIEDLLKLHSELIIDYSSATGLTIQPGDLGRKNPLQRLNFIRYIWDEKRLDKVLEAIIDNPHKALITEEIRKDIDEVGMISPYRIMDMVTDSQGVVAVKSGGHFTAGGSYFAFTKAYDEVVRISYDTYPNRFVKFFLNYLYMELHAIIDAIQAYIQNNSSNNTYFLSFLNRAKEIENKYVLRYLSRDFFKEVSDLQHLTIPPQALLKEDRYQTVFTSFQDLLKGVIADKELEQMLKDPIVNMPELYEYWCFLKTWELIKKSKGIGTITFTVNEKYGETSINKWEITWKKDAMALTYQKYIPDKIENKPYSYSVPFRPDIFLEVNNSMIILDAKYRVDFIEEIEKITSDAQAEKELEAIRKAERRGEYKLDDLYKMHTYREAIRKKKKEDFEKPVWVIALYPGTETKLFDESGNKYTDANDESLKRSNGGVGTIQLKPDSDKELAGFLKTMLI